MRPLRCLLAPLGLAALLSACATAPPVPPLAATAPQGWSTPLPHAGETVALREWWARLDDPLLPELIAQADDSSPSLELATARIDQARAAARAAGAGLWPQIGLGAGATRARQPAGQTPGLAQATSTTAQAGIDAGWEIDLFGARRQAVNAAQARTEAGRLQWHDARISLAAEVAQTYVSLRACEAAAAVVEQQAQSQARSADLTRQKVRVGFEAPANGSLADAAAAESANRGVGQRADCAVLRQTLVLLTGVPHAVLAPRLSARAARLPQPAAFAVREVPADALSQRPDLRAAQATVAAAAADVGAARAERWPALRLAGSIAAVATEVAGVRSNGTSWSIGPALSLPLFDAGLRAANADAALARYDEARAQFEQQARAAVREVEEALVRLQASQARLADAERAAQGFRDYFRAAEQRWEVGAGSLIEMEDARRLALNAQAGLISLQRERVAAWIALYKAVGGGWDGRSDVPTARTSAQGNE